MWERQRQTTPFTSRQGVEDLHCFPLVSRRSFRNRPLPWHWSPAHLYGSRCFPQHQTCGLIWMGRSLSSVLASLPAGRPCLPHCPSLCPPPCLSGNAGIVPYFPSRCSHDGCAQSPGPPALAFYSCAQCLFLQKLFCFCRDHFDGNRVAGSTQFDVQHVKMNISLSLSHLLA